VIELEFVANIRVYNLKKLALEWCDVTATVFYDL
jgi:hypothetical protein